MCGKICKLNILYLPLYSTNKNGYDNNQTN